MTQEFGTAALDDLDQALVHALQIAPRAGWARIGAAVGADPVTVARRWQRLARSGAAWIGCHPGPAAAESGQGCLAFVEVDCANGRLTEVARALTAEAHVITVEHVSGGRDLLLTVLAPRLSALTHWVTHRLGALDGIVTTRTHLASTVYTEGSRWRLRALSSEQIARLAEDAAPRGDASVFELTDLDHALLAELSVDGRASNTVLAERCGTSPDTVRRRVNRLLSSGMAQFRCEVARPLSEWPVSLILWGRAAPAELRTVAEQVTGAREVRLCAGVIGRHNLKLVAWVRSLDDAQRFEVRLAERVPALTVVDRAVALWPMKLNGNLLDERGYRTGAVPIDVRSVAG
ncbi:MULTISPECIES: Lrp/AsnC family transcriptional regulator [unclassified Streptomyces]|uniref:Lrp/AsnC family transcriptional regulator n=1 Tax=unclassified Streptomyces TaxID=2593676 RepID=UPI000DC25D87|nr:Lrp/AsnC family transcriptional regulator [Streptomyces sp. PsTaAH-137]RAJ91735.1 DNA-binding Lrp family transcriptional regulator [Streptomyces sp. PsTaAH-137]